MTAGQLARLGVAPGDLVPLLGRDLGSMVRPAWPGRWCRT